MTPNNTFIQESKLNSYSVKLSFLLHCICIFISEKVSNVITVEHLSIKFYINYMNLLNVILLSYLQFLKIMNIFFYIFIALYLT